MYIHTRLPVVAAVLLVILPLSLAQMGANIVAKNQATQQFQGVIEEASDQNQLGRSLFQTRRMQQAQRSRLVHRLSTIDRERRKLRRQIQNMQDTDVLYGSAGEYTNVENAVAVSQQLQSTRFSNPLSLLRANRFLRRLILRAGFHKSSPTLQAVSQAENVLALRTQDQALLKQEGLAQADFLRNDLRVRASTEQLGAARQMMRQVQEVIAALQFHLARIDAQIARRQERAGVADGTLDAQRNKYAEAVPQPVTFDWPAIARISAGFREASYRKFFGIPHNGIDIVVPQGTPVKAAADGVVFLARNAGMGYSYILVGHRDGYATLYGHLSRITVSTGDAIVAGQVIGFSGGAKGGPGSGLVTTGAHLHFEMIKDGTHIDPQTKLP